ncbi:hypothetical protein Tco_1206099 [Tanacetum coccineum]
MDKSLQISNTPVQKISMTSAMSLGPFNSDNIDLSGRMDSWTMRQRRVTAPVSSDMRPDKSAGRRSTIWRSRSRLALRYWIWAGG